MIREIFEKHRASFPHPWGEKTYEGRDEFEEMAVVLEFMNGERARIDDGLEDFWLRSCPAYDLFGMAVHVISSEMDGRSENAGHIEWLYGNIRSKLHDRIFRERKLTDHDWVNFSDKEIMREIRDSPSAAKLNERRAAA